MAAEPAGTERSAKGPRPPAVRLRPRPGTSMRREMVLFVTTGLVALVAVGTGVYLISDKVARDNALRDTETQAARITDYLVAPLLSTVLEGETEDRRDLDQLVATGTDQGTLRAVLVWRSDGTVVYASDPALEQQRLPLTPELTAAIQGQVVSDLDTSAEVPGAALATGPFLEVYTPLRLSGRSERYVLEAYFDTSMIDRDAAVFWYRILPVALGALVVLQAAQIPIAVSLTRRLNRHEAERTHLVQRHLALSDRERREIAADIHDGPVQDLAGVSYALSAVIPNMPEEQATRARRLVDAVRGAIASLRHLMVDIYPPDLSSAGLTTAVHHLADPLRERGLTVHVEQDALPELSSGATAVLYRTVKEALTNVGRHAHARTVWIRLEQAEHDELPAVRLRISDDGVGFPPRPPGDRRSAPRGRNFGLQFLRDRVVKAGGTVAFTNREDGGAVVDVLLPAEDTDAARDRTS